MEFLNHYQFPIWYDIGTYLLTSLCQYTYIDIYDHIHEWRIRRRMIKTSILMDWFTQSLLPPISKDVSMAGVAIKEKAILHEKHLDLIYY